MSLSIKIILPQVFILIFSLGSIFSQTNIAKQSFEASGDTWAPITFSTPPCTNGDDVWDFSTSIGIVSPDEGSQFWGIADLNGNCGGTEFETIILPNVDISVYTSVIFSFSYNAFEFDNGDDLKYELFYDNVSQGEVPFFNGNSNFSSSDWDTVTVSIPGTTSNVSVVLYAKQNGEGDYGGFDNVFLEGISTCTPATISSVSPSTGSEGTTVTITASSGDLTGGSVSFNGVAAKIASSNATTIVCTVPAGATSGDLTIGDNQPCTTIFSSFTVTCGPTTEPTSDATTLNFSDVQCQDLTFDWANGDGANRIVVMSTSAIGGTPSDQTSYIANSVYGTGSPIAAGEFVVYNGSSNTVNVTGLSASTNYFVNIFEYNGATVNCTENYLTSSPLSGSQTTLSVCATCPQVKSVLVNACNVNGGAEEGLNEYVVFKNGSSALSVDDIQIDFDTQGSYCNTLCGTNTIGNNATYISNLNATASCSKFVYLDPIPANATVILFTGQSPSLAYNFSSLCPSNEQVVALFCDNVADGNGRFTNGSGVKQTDLTWGSCTQSLFIEGSLAGGDGGFANFDASGAVTYSNDGACIATALPVELLYFDSEVQNKSVKLMWESYSEIDALDYVLLKSRDGLNYSYLGTIKAAGNSNQITEYSFTDLKPNEGYNYYQLKLINIDFKEEVLGATSSVFNNGDIVIKSLANEWKINTPFDSATVDLYAVNGRLIRSYSMHNKSLIITNSDLEKGIYMLVIKSNKEIISKKIMK